MNFTEYSYTVIYSTVRMCQNIIQFYEPFVNSAFPTQHNRDAKLRIVYEPDCFSPPVSFRTEISLCNLLRTYCDIVYARDWKYQNHSS